MRSCKCALRVQWFIVNFFVVQMKSDEEQMVAYTYWFPACLELWLASEDFVG
jgi:hypothetical protein